MRIIGGSLKGRVLRGDVKAGTRPTTDAVRELMFAVLDQYVDWSACTVIDACCGTGALGIEALSRGAVHCTFVDKNPAMCRMVDENLRTLSIVSASAITCADAMQTVRTAGVNADVIFYDPPYEHRSCNQFLHAVEQGHACKDGGIVVAEHDDREVIISMPQWTLLTTKRRGATVIDVLQFHSS